MENNNLKNIVIAGAGVMGASIAQVFAGHAHTVRVYGRSEASLEKGRALAEINQRSQVAEGILTPDQSSRLLANIDWSCELRSFEQADFVIESIVEDMEQKQEFWRKISCITPDDCILTTNTSGLSITQMAQAVKNPQRFAGMHWVNPPHIVPLVEIISGRLTAEKTIDAIYKLAVCIGKKPVRVMGDSKGFILNRIQFAVLREAMHIVENNIASMQDVDDVLKYGLGMRYACLGPFEIADIGGIDTFMNVASYLFADLSDAKIVSPLLKKLYEKGEYGLKSQKGFYDYSKDKAAQVIEKRDRDFLKIARLLYGE
jgi:3-hydroxybutyryl-CoA dehydrogenase